MSITLEEVEISNGNDDTLEDGLGYKCSLCGCVAFVIFELVRQRGHLHLQCVHCNNTSCDNTCGHKGI